MVRQLARQQARQDLLATTDKDVPFFSAQGTPLALTLIEYASKSPRLIRENDYENWVNTVERSLNDWTCDPISSNGPRGESPHPAYKERGM